MGVPVDMADQELFARPPRGTIPLSKGGDLVIDFLQRVDGLYTDYGAGVTVALVIDALPVRVTSPGTISTYHALCKVESEVADLIPAGISWRCIVSYPTIPRTEIIAMNGVTSRAD